MRVLRNIRKFAEHAHSIVSMCAEIKQEISRVRHILKTCPEEGDLVFYDETITCPCRTYHDCKQDPSLILHVQNNLLTYSGNVYTLLTNKGTIKKCKIMCVCTATPKSLWKKV